MSRPVFLFQVKVCKHNTLCFEALQGTFKPRKIFALIYSLDKSTLDSVKYVNPGTFLLGRYRYSTYCCIFIMLI